LLDDGLGQFLHQSDSRIDLKSGCSMRRLNEAIKSGAS
jgi:hypothetical protein